MLGFTQRVTQQAAQRELSEQRSTEKDDSIFFRVVQAKTVAASQHWFRGCYLQLFQTFFLHVACTRMVFFLLQVSEARTDRSPRAVIETDTRFR